MGWIFLPLGYPALLLLQRFHLSYSTVHITGLKPDRLDMSQNIFSCSVLTISSNSAGGLSGILTPGNLLYFIQQLSRDDGLPAFWYFQIEVPPVEVNYFVKNLILGLIQCHAQTFEAHL
jgi:hypothetical protein